MPPPNQQDKDDDEILDLVFQRIESFVCKDDNEEGSSSIENLKELFNDVLQILSTHLTCKTTTNSNKGKESKACMEDILEGWMDKFDAVIPCVAPEADSPKKKTDFLDTVFEKIQGATCSHIESMLFSSDKNYEDDYLDNICEEVESQACGNSKPPTFTEQLRNLLSLSGSSNEEECSVSGSRDHEKFSLSDSAKPLLFSISEEGSEYLSSEETTDHTRMILVEDVTSHSRMTFGLEDVTSHSRMTIGEEDGTSHSRMTVGVEDATSHSRMSTGVEAPPSHSRAMVTKNPVLEEETAAPLVKKKAATPQDEAITREQKKIQGIRGTIHHANLSSKEFVENFTALVETIMGTIVAKSRFDPGEIDIEGLLARREKVEPAPILLENEANAFETPDHMQKERLTVPENDGINKFEGGNRRNMSLDKKSVVLDLKHGVGYPETHACLYQEERVTPETQTTENPLKDHSSIGPDVVTDSNSHNNVETQRSCIPRPEAALCNVATNDSEDTVKTAPSLKQRGLSSRASPATVDSSIDSTGKSSKSASQGTKETCDETEVDDDSVSMQMIACVSIHTNSARSGRTIQLHSERSQITPMGSCRSERSISIHSGQRTVPIDIEFIGSISRDDQERSECPRPQSPRPFDEEPVSRSEDYSEKTRPVSCLTVGVSNSDEGQSSDELKRNERTQDDEQALQAIASEWKPTNATESLKSFVSDESQKKKFGRLSPDTTLGPYQDDGSIGMKMLASVPAYTQSMIEATTRVKAADNSDMEEKLHKADENVTAVEVEASFKAMNGCAMEDIPIIQTSSSPILENISEDEFEGKILGYTSSLEEIPSMETALTSVEEIIQQDSSQETNEKSSSEAVRFSGKFDLYSSLSSYIKDTWIGDNFAMKAALVLMWVSLSTVSTKGQQQSPAIEKKKALIKTKLESNDRISRTEVITLLQKEAAVP